jgi:hypothetical protein
VPARHRPARLPGQRRSPGVPVWPSLARAALDEQSAGDRRSRRPADAPELEPKAAPALSPHRTDPAQLTLFTMRRDWRPALGAADLPALTGAAQRLLDDFSRAQPAPGDDAAWKPAARALRILAAWLGADAPFHEADVRAMAGLRPGVQVRRVLTFLAARDLLIADPARQADLDLASATLTIRRGLQRRVICLDEVTAALASQWLRYRHQRSPVGPTMIRAMFEPLGVRPDRLRQDRILDEARHTADPVHLVRVFGITESTAINYVHAAHPGRQSVIPR